MICTDCRRENLKEARCCLICGAALAVQCANCQAELPAAARFCMNCSHPVRSSTPVDTARLTRLAAATPAPLARKVRAAADLSGEQRVVSIPFAEAQDRASSSRAAWDEQSLRMAGAELARAEGRWPDVLALTEAQAVLDAMHGFGGDAPQFDDVTLMVIARMDTGEPARLTAVER